MSVASVLGHLDPLDPGTYIEDRSSPPAPTLAAAAEPAAEHPAAAAAAAESTAVAAATVAAAAVAAAVAAAADAAAAVAAAVVAAAGAAAVAAAASASFAASDDASFDEHLAALSDEANRGQPIEIALQPGEYELAATILLDATAVVSELRLTAAASTVTLRASSAELLRTVPGAPPLRLSGLTLRGRVNVNGSRAHISGCAFEDVEADGAALAVVNGAAAEVVATSFELDCREHGARARDQLRSERTLQLVRAGGRR